MKLEATAELLIQRGLVEEGKSIFINEMPGECALGVLLRDNNAGTQVNHYLPGYRATDLTVAVRSREIPAGRALAWKVFDALFINGDLQLSQVQLKSVRPQNEPRMYRRSNGAFFEWEMEIEMNYVIAAA